MPPQPDERSDIPHLRYLRLLLIFVSPVVFALGLAFLAYETGQSWNDPFSDFHFVWVAGDLWNSGQSPYSESFNLRLEGMPGSRPEALYYPPSWYPLASLVALLDPTTASQVWRLLISAMLLGASVLNVATFRMFPGKVSIQAANAPLQSFALSLPFLTLLFLHFGYMGLSQAAVKNIEIAQFSVILYFGVSLLVFSLSREKLLPGAIGLALIMLKPQLGVAIVLGLLVTALGRRIVFVAAIISILMTAPALMTSSLFEIATNLLSNLSVYDQQQFNTAPATTGLRNIVWTLGGDDAGMSFYQLAALFVIMLLGAVFYVRFKKLPQPIDLVMLSIAVTFFIAPVHYYSFVTISVLALYCLSQPTASAIACGLAFAIIARAGNLPNPPTLQGPGVMAYGGNLYMTIGAAIILVVLIRNLWSGITPVTADQESS